MTGTVTTAVRPATVCLLVTTQRLSQTHPCTSTPWVLGRSTTLTAAQTPSTVTTWILGTREEAGRCVIGILSQYICFHTFNDKSQYRDCMDNMITYCVYVLKYFY